MDGFLVYLNFTEILYFTLFTSPSKKVGHVCRIGSDTIQKQKFCYRILLQNQNPNFFRRFRILSKKHVSHGRRDINRIFFSPIAMLCRLNLIPLSVSQSMQFTSWVTLSLEVSVRRVCLLCSFHIISFDFLFQIYYPRTFSFLAISK